MMTATLLSTSPMTRTKLGVANPAAASLGWLRRHEGRLQAIQSDSVLPAVDVQREIFLRSGDHTVRALVRAIQGASMGVNAYKHIRAAEVVEVYGPEVGMMASMLRRLITRRDVRGCG